MAMDPGAPARYLATPIQTHQSVTQGDRGRGVLVAVDRVRHVAGTESSTIRFAVCRPLAATSVIRDRNGGLWIGTAAHGLVHSYEGKTSRFTSADGLSSDEVLALFEDREGTIWVGTSEGIDRFRQWPVTPLLVNQGLSNANTNSVLAAHDGSIWIGTADGLNRWKEGRTTIYRRRNDPGLPDDSSNHSSRMNAATSGFRDRAVSRRSKTGSLRPSRPCPVGLRTRSQTTTVVACGSAYG